MKNRYIFFKKLFPNYLIIFIKDNKYKTMGIDLNLLKYRTLEDISYIIVDEQNKIEIYEAKVNNYPFYLYQEFLLNLIEGIIR